MPNETDASAARGVRASNRASFESRLLETASAHLAAHGPHDLGMRALARDLDVTPGALYRYVAGRDELLTLLVVNAYRSLGTAIEAAERDARARDAADLAARWRAVWRAARRWAVEHRHEFALVYGTPVADYDAPPETIEPASAITRLLAGIAVEAMLVDRGAGDKPSSASGATDALPPALAADLERIRAWLRSGAAGVPVELADRIPTDALIAVVRAWTELIGTISFEVFGHYAGSMESGEAYLDAAADRSFAEVCRAVRG